MRVAAQNVDSVGLEATIAAIPGTVAVYARLMNGKPAAIAIRADEPFPSASIIKLAIMLTAYRGYERGSWTPDAPVTVHASDLIGGSDALAGTPAGAQVPMQSLVKAMITVSDNSASNALISYFGFGQIEAEIVRAGMTHTRLARHFADTVPSWRKNLNTTTAGDMGRLLYAIERGAREGLTTVASSASCRAMIDVMLGNTDTSKIVHGLPSSVHVAHKTGELSAVRHDVGIVAPYGDVPFVLAVLTSDDADTNAADAGIGRIAARVFAAFKAASSIALARAAIVTPPPATPCIRYDGRCE